MALEDAKNPLVGTSGPGRFSKRTDIDPPSEYYGQKVEDAAIKAGAPLAKSPDIRPLPGSEIQRAATSVTPLFAPTELPEEPVTNGVNIGDGMGAEALAMRQPDDTNFRSAIQSAKPVLAFIADQPNTSPETRAAIRQLWDM
jgi:hypothetical protein